MTRHARRTSRALAMAAAAATMMLAIGAMGASARAASSYWDGDSTAPANGGSGAWDATSANWSPTAGGSTFAAFNPSDDAVFGGSAGVVQVGANSAPAVTANSLAFTPSGYTLINPSAAASTLTLTSGIVDTGIGTIEIEPGLAGGSGLIKNGTGILVFDGANTYTGNTVINAGTLALGNTAVADIPDSSQVQIASGAKLDLGRNGGYYNDTVGSIDGAGNIHFGSAPSGYGALTGSVLVAGGDGSFTSFTGVMSGAGGQFVKTGVGQITLSGVNTITGSYTVNNGTLTVTGGNSIDDSTPVFVNPSFDSTGAVIGAGTLQLAADETIGGLGGSFANGNPQIVDLGGFTLTLNSSRNIAYNSSITNVGNLVKTGSGIEQLANANSNFLGSITIKQGTLIASRPASLGNSSNGVTLDGGTLSNFVAAGVSYSSSRNFVVTSNNGGINVIQGHIFGLSSTVAGTISGPGQFTKGGPGTLNLNNPANSFAGGLVVNEGNASSNVASGTPFGTGSIQDNGFVVINAGAAGATINIAGGAGSTFTYGPGSQLQANGGGSGVFTLNIGGTTATSGMIQGPGGTLVVIPLSLANLGNPAAPSRDQIIVSGAMPLKNGIVSPSIVSWQSTGSSGGDFLTYGANGLALATYSGSDLNAAGATDVIKLAAAQSLTANRQVYALNTTGQTVTLNDGVNPFNFTIGDGTGVAGMIMNQHGEITNGAVPGGQLIFDGDEATVYTQNIGTTPPLNFFDAPWSITGGGGFTKFGYGALQINKAGAYAGPTRIGQGSLVLGASDVLPATTDLHLDGFAGSQNNSTNVNYPQLRLGSFNQTVASLSGTNSVAILDLGSGSLTVNQNIDTAYAGVIQGTNGGQLIKQGSGTLTLTARYISPAFPTVPTTTGSGFNSVYEKLRISGGTVAAASVAALPAAPGGSTPTVFIPDAITLENGAKLQWNGINTVESNLTSADEIDQGAGLTLGAGGGTIEVTHPAEILILQGIGVQSTDPLDPNFNKRNAIVHDVTGSGDLTKTGPGILRLYANAAALDPTGTTPDPIANSYTGKTIVLGGTLQISDDGALGQPPATLVPDQLTIDNNAVLQSNGPGNIAATRGVTIGAGGGQLYATGSFTINSPLAGTGTLTKTGAGSLTLNAASPSFSGHLNLTAGSTFFNATGAAGTGIIDIDARFPVIFGSNANTNVTLNNGVMIVGAGAQVTTDVDGTSQLEFSGPFAGTGNLYKTGTGTLKLSGTPAYTGGLVAREGTIELNTSFIAGSAAMVQETGKIALTPSGGTHVLKTGQLAVAPGGLIDLTDNKLIVTQPSSTGTWNGAAYTGLTGLVASARNNGAWNGTTGITTSSATPGSNFTTLGVATAGQIKGIVDTATATFAGQTVHGSDTIVMYTYGGDANLDGKINIDDYGRIDSNVGLSGTVFGWSKGDFNYDGKINIDDYGIIDGNIGIQGPPFPTAAQSLAGFADSGVSAVPEPTSLALIALAGGSLLRRRRRTQQ